MSRAAKAGVLLALALAVFAGPPAPPQPPTLAVNCGNESANEGGSTPERDLTPAEWDLYCQ